MKNACILALALTGSISLGHAGEPSIAPAAAKVVSESQVKAAHREKNVAMAAIKSREELTSYMLTTPLQKSPLSFLSKEGRQSFLDSLTFNSNGVTGFRFGSLEEELTPTQIFQVLSLFGAQDMTRGFKRARVKTVTDQKLLKGEGYSTSEYDDVWDDIWDEGVDFGGTDKQGFYCDLDGICKPANDQRFICTARCKSAHTGK